MTDEFGDEARHRSCYELRFEPMRNEEGRVIAAFQFATDVTQRLRDRLTSIQRGAAPDPHGWMTRLR